MTTPKYLYDHEEETHRRMQTDPDLFPENSFKKISFEQLKEEYPECFAAMPPLYQAQDFLRFYLWTYEEKMMLCAPKKDMEPKLGRWVQRWAFDLDEHWRDCPISLDLVMEINDYKEE